MVKKWANWAFRQYYRMRYLRFQRRLRQPHLAQQQLLKGLLQKASGTEYGQRYQFAKITSPRAFAEEVPLTNYDDLKPYLQRMMLGERNVLWPGQVRWFSKSAGTTNDKSKFIPVTSENRRSCHLRGTWDTMMFYYHQRPMARQFAARTMLMGGSIQPYAEHPATMVGDISAIMISHMPWVARPFFAPDFQTALLPEWEEKLERLASYGARQQDIVMIGGVPTWTVVLFRRILEITGKANMLEVWPNFEVYVHGGVSFTPYAQQFAEFFPGNQVDYIEIYNASEGFFAVQDDLTRDDMLLLLQNGVYYEFLPMDEWDAQHPSAVPLAEVEPGKNYALVISTNSGLWRYLPGDTITFTTTDPYRIQVSGRMKQFVNAFGEEVIVENTDRALAATCESFQALVTEYTVAPVYFSGEARGGHEWAIEFARPPRDLSAFAEHLDLQLQQLNSDYEAKRYHDLALVRLHINQVPEGTFHHWMKARGKLGGQHKVPRLANHRTYLEEILRMAAEAPSA